MKNINYILVFVLLSISQVFGYTNLKVEEMVEMPIQMQRSLLKSALIKKEKSIFDNIRSYAVKLRVKYGFPK